MSMVIPTFANVDFGLPGGSLNPDDAASRVTHCQVGDLAIARVGFSFAGVDGVFRHNLGARGREVIWQIVIRAIDLDTLNLIEKNIDAAKAAGVGELTTTTGRVFSRAIIESYRPAEMFDVIRSGDYEGWVAREATIVFKVLSGD